MFNGRRENPSRMSDPSEDPEFGICEKCIGSPIFAHWVVQNGHKGECEFDSAHGSSNTVVSVEEFAEEVDRYFRETYQLGEEFIYATEDSDNPSYDTHGAPYEDILANDRRVCQDRQSVRQQLGNALLRAMRQRVGHRQGAW
jgi:hypothetical protein